MTDSQGKLLWKGRYDAWGQLIHDSNRHAQRRTHQPFRLQNQYFDQETGLHYNFLRYYEPALGRFITQDPIGLMGGMNLYRFEGTVQNQVDPLGLMVQMIAAYWLLEALAHATAAMTGILIGVGIVEATEATEDEAEAQAEADGTAKCNETKCPPCSPYPVGTLGYIGPRIVQRGADGARNNDGIGIPHFKVFAVQQNPKDCTCRWQQTQKVMQIYGHHTKFIPSGAIDLNGKGDPPSYP